jgi:N-acetylmuramoyl-L-alanine amidase CwlA
MLTAKNIIQNFIPGLPKIPYFKGVGNYIGVVAHSVGTYESTVENERLYECEHFNEAFVHFFVSDVKILQVADVNYKAYGAGKAANAKYVHVELCQSKDHNKFLKAYENWTWTLAYVLSKKDLGVYDGRTLVSHDWVSKNLGGTDHTDPIGYLKQHGKTWNDVVKDVKFHYMKQKAPVVSKITVNDAAEFICDKIHTKEVEYWQKTGTTLQYFDDMLTKIATKWKEDNAINFTDVKRLPPKINMTVNEALIFIDSKVNLSDLRGWELKSVNVPWLALFFVKVAYTWQKEYEVEDK